jgi:hypothetical protein
MDHIAPLPAAGNVSHLDGHSFIGLGGLLGVALTRKALHRLRRTASATHWLIPLTDPELAAEAAGLPGEVLWLSPEPPAKQLGLLNLDVQGVWKDGDAVTINACGQSRKLLLPEVPLLSATVPCLARAFVDFWMNYTAEAAGLPESKLVEPPAAMEVAA